MKKLFYGFLIVLCLGAIAFAVLLLTGKVSLEKEENSKAQTVARSAFYVVYMDSYVTVGSDGSAMLIGQQVPQGIPLVTGLEFDSIVEKKPLSPRSQSSFDYALLVAESVRLNSIPEIKELFVTENGEMIMYYGNVKILLGTNHDTEEKITDLKAFIGEVYGMEGTLFMQEINSHGYTFKKNSDTEEHGEETYDEIDEETDE